MAAPARFNIHLRNIVGSHYNRAIALRSSLVNRRGSTRWHKLGSVSSRGFTGWSSKVEMSQSLAKISIDCALMRSCF